MPVPQDYNTADKLHVQCPQKHIADQNAAKAMPNISNRCYVNEQYRLVNQDSGSAYP